MTTVMTDVYTTAVVCVASIDLMFCGGLEEMYIRRLRGFWLDGENDDITVQSRGVWNRRSVGQTTDGKTLDLLHITTINERIECKLLSLTYKVLTTSQQDYLHNLISVQSTCISSPVESAPFFISSTSFCSLSSWFTSSCAYHLTTVTTFALSLSPST